MLVFYLESMWTMHQMSSDNFGAVVRNITCDIKKILFSLLKTAVKAEKIFLKTAAYAICFDVFILIL